MLQHRLEILRSRAATSKADGSVKAVISLSCGTATDTVNLDKTIAKLPKTDARRWLSKVVD